MRNWSILFALAAIGTVGCFVYAPFSPDWWLPNTAGQPHRAVSAFGREIDSLFLTAVLTVVGFSVHDTIVVFDRIRENMVVSNRLTFEQVVNLSIMQTAARSIITSFTVVLVLLSLLLFGGDTLKGFALALLIGIISGTYSSIFNASPLLVVWRRLQPVR